MRMKLFFLLLCSSLLYSQTLRLVFQGNKELSARELYGALNLYKPYLYEFYKDEPAVDPRTLPVLLQTLINFYKTKGFYHTKVSYSQNKKAITITIHENTPVRISDITIDSKLDITPKISLEKNDIFDAEKFSQSKKDIKSFYANNSYCNIDLDAKAWLDTEENSAYLVYKVTPNKLCYFGKITINSSENIDANIIKSLLYINEGDPFL